MLLRSIGYRHATSGRPGVPGHGGSRCDAGGQQFSTKSKRTTPMIKTNITISIIGPAVHRPSSPSWPAVFLCEVWLTKGEAASMPRALWA